MKYVVLDRVEPGWTPPYCVHGRATCIGPTCTRWVWLGSETYGAVASGQVAPICTQCANLHLSPGAGPEQRIVDHLRAEGPHDA